MKYRIRFRDGSTEDFEEGIAYYKRISIDLVDKFHQSFRDKINEIEENPLGYQVRYRTIRIANMKHFPFSIHFIVEGNIIYILKVLHQKRYYK